MPSNIGQVGEKMPSLHRGSLKTIFYIVLLATLLLVMNFIFGWANLEEIPPQLQPYSAVILLLKPYLAYFQAGLIFILGYLTINAASGLVYAYMRGAADHPTAAAVRSISRISGIAILLSLMASVFNVNPAAALTVGSFGGLVVGFATQTILSHVVAGVFLLLSRPFTIGDTVTVAGQTGVVKEIRLMHLVLETEDREILIPSGTVVTQIIQKKRPPQIPKPIETMLALEDLPSTAVVGSTVRFAGRLVEVSTGNPVGGVPVKILESDIGKDDLLASGVTRPDGTFNIEWTAKKTDWRSNKAEVYAKFEGNDDHSRSQTKHAVMTLVSTGTAKGS